MENEFLDSFSINKKPISFIETFESLCVRCINMGMTYEQFWDGDPEMVKYYAKAYGTDKERRNEGYWLQGLYIYKALLNIWPAMRFGSKEKVKDYIEKPIPITEETLEENKLSKEKAQFERNRAFMTRFASSYNKKFAKEKRYNVRI